MGWPRGRKRTVGRIASSSSSNSEEDEVEEEEAPQRIIYDSDVEKELQIEVPCEHVSKELVDIKLSDVDVKMVPRSVLDLEVAKLKEPSPRTCLFQLLVSGCPGIHEDTLSMIKCASKGIDYNPICCWFCYKVGKHVAFSNFEDLADHQDGKHDEQTDDLDDNYAFVELKNRKKESLISIYLKVRSKTVETDEQSGKRTLKRTLTWFKDRIASDNHSNEWKRNLFSTEFGYAAFSCKLCHEKWIKSEKPIIFSVALMNEEAKDMIKAHLEKYHLLSYKKYSNINYWFDSRAGKIIALERLYQRLLHGDAGHADGGENHDSNAAINGVSHLIEESDSDRSVGDQSINIRNDIPKEKNEDVDSEMDTNETQSLMTPPPRTVVKKEPSSPSRTDDTPFLTPPTSQSTSSSGTGVNQTPIAESRTSTVVPIKLVKSEPQDVPKKVDVSNVEQPKEGGTKKAIKCGNCKIVQHFRSKKHFLVHHNSCHPDDGALLQAVEVSIKLFNKLPK